MSVGRILRFDEVRGYGFIAPSNGGEDVFFHANDFGDQRHLVRPDARVEYEAEEGDRGLKVASVRIIGGPAHAGSEARTTGGDEVVRPASRDDDGMCDVLAPRQFVAEVTEVLVNHVPSLTGAQIAQIRQHMADHARSHGWIDG
ncbi:cold shock domain-containing protein [Micromonospora sp. CPCC 205371]|nr:cold shock domain-containing protein [Micromonospora sp. CPCC 205371]